MKSPRRVARLTRRLGTLFDAQRRDLQPVQFWRSGSYFTHPARAKALVLVLLLPPGRNGVLLARQAAGLLEARKGLVLDWAGKDRRNGVWIIFKTLACDPKSGRNRELRLDPDDLAALRSLAPGRKARPFSQPLQRRLYCSRYSPLPG